MVVKNEDDSYTILINAKLSHDAQIAAYQHAIRHINNGDFDRNYGDVQEIETVAHRERPIIVTPTPASDSVITVTENIKQSPRQRRKRKRNRKQERYMMDRAEFITEYCDSFSLAEHQYLYGSDL